MATRHPLRNSGAALIEDGQALVVESPGRERFPVEMGVLSLTSRCNLGCVMCLEPRGPGPVDLPLDVAMGFVETFAGRVPTIWSCAGEALLHPRFLEVARAIAARGTRLGLGTNGVPLPDPAAVRRCAEAGVRWLHVSCHTCRPERFAALTGATSPRQFEALVSGLRNVDDWNAGHAPEQRLEVLLQLVLMTGLAAELDDYLGFVAGLLAHSPLVVRVEPMQPLNRAREHPELQLDLAEVGRIVRLLVTQHSQRFTFEFKGVPLCLLEGAEGLSEDLRKRAAGSVVVGNLGYDSADLQLQCPIGDPAQSAFAARCETCSLVTLCPGVMDNPVPEGAPWPRPSHVDPVALLAGLGLRTDFAHRRFALIYPRYWRAPDPDAPPPEPAPPPALSEPAPPPEPPVSEAEASAPAPGPAPEPAAPPPPEPPVEDDRGPLDPERLDLDPIATARLAPADLRLVQWITRLLEREGLVTESRVTDRFAALLLRAAEGAPGPSLVVFEPAAACRRSIFAVGAIAVRYNGELTSELRGHLDRIGRLLGTGRPPRR